MDISEIKKALLKMLISEMRKDDERDFDKEEDKNLMKPKEELMKGFLKDKEEDEEEEEVEDLLKKDTVEEQLESLMPKSHSMQKVVVMGETKEDLEKGLDRAKEFLNKRMSFLDQKEASPLKKIKRML